MGKRTQIALVMALFFVFTSTGFGQEMPKRRWRTQWIISAVALTAANLLDAQSSAGAFEANPLMRNSQGRFATGRAFAYKSAASGGILLIEALLIRKNPSYEKTAAIGNFVSAGALAGVAVRNSQVK
ncbi:MAG: hypothetical protein ACM336_08550 [Acidobacteriota bacterium]